MEEELIKTNETAKLLRVSKDHFRKVVKHQPNFPKPLQITPNGHPKWRKSEINAFIAGEYKKAA